LFEVLDFKQLVSDFFISCAGAATFCSFGDDAPFATWFPFCFSSFLLRALPLRETWGRRALAAAAASSRGSRAPWLLIRVEWPRDCGDEAKPCAWGLALC
jgi:hypothetical protein